MEVSVLPPSSARISMLCSYRPKTPTYNYKTKLLKSSVVNKLSYAPFIFCQVSQINQNHDCSNVTPKGLNVPRASQVRTHQVGATEIESTLKSMAEFLYVFWKFLRPHTIQGTILASTAMVVRMSIENANLLNGSLLLKAFLGLITLLCANGYVVGINQIYDVEIDKVNKPYLPICSGDLSIHFAWLLVILLAVTGAGIIGMLNFGPLISSLYFLSLFLGSIYSVPPFRLKRFPVAAFLIIATVRGFILNYLVYSATRASLGLPFQWSLPVAFITIFATVFAFVIAITKDLPDVEGDRKFNIPTLATNVGVRNMALLGSGFLLLNYAAPVALSIFMPQAFKRSIMIPAHVVLSLTLISQAWLLDQKNYTKEANEEFYRFIWNIYYAEFLLFPFI